MSEDQSQPQERQAFQPRFPVLKGGTICNFIRLLENLSTSQREELYRQGLAMRESNRSSNRSSNQQQDQQRNQPQNHPPRSGGPRNTRRPPEERRRGNTNPHRRGEGLSPAKRADTYRSSPSNGGGEGGSGKMTFKQKLTQESSPPSSQQAEGSNQPAGSNQPEGNDQKSEANQPEASS